MKLICLQTLCKMSGKEFLKRSYAYILRGADYTAKLKEQNDEDCMIIAEEWAPGEPGESRITPAMTVMKYKRLVPACDKKPDVLNSPKKKKLKFEKLITQIPDFEDWELEVRSQVHISIKNSKVESYFSHFVFVTHIRGIRTNTSHFSDYDMYMFIRSILRFLQVHVFPAVSSAIAV